ncbi:5-hydroxytryptamine receptor 2B [Lycorma delicatula]|uniref:5-hydroxytryptamine receptor 2B n=1 Tax=Lycorma delicatula TaxID=130591 RepID=UPI003F516FB1
MAKLWAVLASVLVLGTAAGNILVCLAIAWERRLQNVTNYFLMSLAITDLMVAILVMPVGILTLVTGFFPLAPVYCLAWICLDVLFCTASIMHLCTISVDRYLSLRYPMKFGRNKTRKRVTLKIIFVWLLSIAMSLPLCLMYSKDYDSVLVKGVCQIPDPLYKLIGSIVSFYIPLVVMLITYALTVRLLAVQQQNVVDNPSGGWLGVASLNSGMERKSTWKRLLARTPPPSTTPPLGAHHSSTDTEMSTLDNHELWLPDTEPAPSTLSALHHFGAEMLRLSRGLETLPQQHQQQLQRSQRAPRNKYDESSKENMKINLRNELELPHNNNNGSKNTLPRNFKLMEGTRDKLYRSNAIRRRRRASTIHVSSPRRSISKRTLESRKRVVSYHGSSTNKWTTSDSSSNEEQSSDKIKGNQLKSDDNNESVNKDVDVINKQQNPDEIQYQLLNGETNSLNSPTNEKTLTDQDTNNLTLLPPPCRCPYFGEAESSKKVSQNRQNDVVMIIKTSPNESPTEKPISNQTKFEIKHGTGGDKNLLKSNNVIRTSSSSFRLSKSSGCSPKYNTRVLSPSALHNRGEGNVSTVVTWESPAPSRLHRRGSSFGSTTRTMILSSNVTRKPTPILRRSATLKVHNQKLCLDNTSFSTSRDDPLRYSTSTLNSSRNATVRSHHSRNSSVISRTSSRHGRIIRLEQKATKVLGVVFFTFVVLWAPFFVLNLLPSICKECEENISKGVFDLVTWLGYASSMVNPIFYTIFNKVFRQAFKKVLLCKYHRKNSWKPSKNSKV